MKGKTKILTVTLNPAVDLACTVPEFALDQVNRAVSFRSDAGGKGVNIARLLRLFDLEVGATGFLGRENPDIFEKLFKDERIEDTFVRIPGSTRIGIKILDSTTHTTTDINLPGLSPSTEQLAQLFDAVERQLQDTSMVIVAGSLPPGVPTNTVGKLVKLIKSRQVKVFVDTSGPALVQAIKAAPTLIKPNLEELAEYLGHPLKNNGEILREAKMLIDTGIETVVVSLGERGALFVEKDASFFTTPPAVHVVSTVGAGDAMVGGMAAGLAKNLSLPERARLATAVSAAVVTQPGPGLPSLAGVRSIEHQVSVKNENPNGGTDE
jgi:1-phosphofructokinase family hexose kinase